MPLLRRQLKGGEGRGSVSGSVCRGVTSYTIHTGNGTWPTYSDSIVYYSEITSYSIYTSRIFNQMLLVRYIVRYMGYIRTSHNA